MALKLLPTAIDELVSTLEQIQAYHVAVKAWKSANNHAVGNIVLHINAII